MAIKVSVIGAGSIGFTRKLMQDILSVPELQDTHFAFHDINKQNLNMITQLAERDIAANGVPAKISTSLNRRKALDGADYVLNLTRIGGLEAFQSDIDIPLKYGVDQCVGDTICAGGIMYGQRNIPQVLAFCKDIREVAKSDALFLNYSNPMAMNTWAGLTYGGVNMLGLCHGVQGGHHQIVQVIQLLINKGKQPGDRGFKTVTQKDVDIVCAGINHQTWYIKVQYKGKDWTGRLLEGFEQHPTFSKTEKVRIDMLRRFGYYSTESNGHLSEYVPWYRKRTGEIKKWISLGTSWIHGETGGYLRVCTEGRNWFETDFPNWLKQEPPKFEYETRSEEHGSWIIEARETGRVYRGHFNVQNKGAITNVPDDAIVEVPGYIDKNGINIPKVGDLPLGCAAVCNTSISVQRMAVEAAVHGDVDLLKQAMMLDPLTGAVCNPPEVWQMVDELLVAQAKWLPQYKRAIPKAKARLASEKPLGTKKTHGAARVKTKSVAEMRKNVTQARKNADAADKANMTGKSGRSLKSRQGLK
ncbi:MAG: alpha-glucosidase/alpha-galactosidase [Candidatus Latescibacteria bacterium]|nr:alpha-glucosidase/alpha-galactosidase [Candidatus Latescibacterota bacterium]